MALLYILVAIDSHIFTLHLVVGIDLRLALLLAALCGAHKVEPGVNDPPSIYTGDHGDHWHCTGHYWALLSGIIGILNTPRDSSRPHSTAGSRVNILFIFLNVEYISTLHQQIYFI